MTWSKRDRRSASSAPRRRIVCIAWVAWLLWHGGTADSVAAQSNLAEAAGIDVEVADAWMAHLVREEHHSFEQQRWGAGAAFSLAAVGWSVGFALRQRAQQSPLSGALLSGAFAASAGFAAATFSIRDPNKSGLVVNLGGTAEFVMASHTATFLTNRGCRDDCFLMLSADSTTAVTSAVVTLLTYALYRPLRVSAHYAAYARLPPEARPRFALHLLEEREWRQRRSDDINLVYGLALSVGYAIAATQARTTSGQIVLSASGGALGLYQSISYLISLFADKPSERLRANALP